ncbi:hypothetical protein HQ47_02330 [Porphyromonas macacae]|uniref:DUF6249 domain-containing protein n=1 Tax=Porphyromonas macacae TaxID=28115 RepID=A0A0A2E8G6_9PORP|nr:DUF6249 domain-containing protein [Porphyromonas macacae]KGN75198.1 hypothetical protein HQ47_02330 [Porphyromonas macacae]
MNGLFAALIIGIIFWVIFKIFELFVRRSERLKIIDHISDLPDGKVLSENLFPKHVTLSDRLSIKIASLIIGMAFGIGLFFLFSLFNYDLIRQADTYFYDYNSVFLIALVLLFGGLGLLIPSLYFYKKDKKA